MQRADRLSKVTEYKQYKVSSFTCRLVVHCYILFVLVVTAPVVPTLFLYTNTCSIKIQMYIAVWQTTIVFEKSYCQMEKKDKQIKVIN